jgi:hypothetical protein
VANGFISHFNTQTMHIKSMKHKQHCYDFPKKPDTLAGFEHGLAVPEAPMRHATWPHD